MSEADLIAARRANLDALRRLGFDPFQALRFDVTARTAEIAQRYAPLAAGESADETHALAGRLMAIRGAGKTFFADLVDRGGKLQIYVRKDEVGDQLFEAFASLDRGDILGVRGNVFRSKMGELTLRVSAFDVVGKALQPLPDKWHGLVDIEKRYRQRYVDLMMNDEVREIFVWRSRIVAEMRRFIDARGFLEFETATLLNVAGGAAARRFRTHVNALDIDMDLRIATELNLKRLVVGGLERVYEIGRIFRNEGIDHKRNPEFTMLELYAAYWSKDDMLAFNEELLAHLVAFVHGADTLTYEGKTISFQRPFARIPFLEALERWGGYGREQILSPDGAARILAELGIAPSPTHAHAIDKIFEAVAEPHMVEPTFVIDYPLVLSPLAKRKAGDPEIVDRYELFCANFEIANAFSELNDPDDQRSRFEAQRKEHAAGDQEIPAPDWDFVTALEYGMPATAGIGIGVDRLVMLLTNQISVRDVILFPLLRPTLNDSN
ncbi:MAG: lysine--tRNA ligase [Candidatus Eremiobacteraeota bacterium]|nr:lysine--tRNA ligase [Candidatus Eremiobacteraeota bacterium]